MQDPQILKFIELEAANEEMLDRLERTLNKEYEEKKEILDAERKELISEGMGAILEEKKAIELAATQEVRIISADMKTELITLETKDVEQIAQSIMNIL